MIKIEKFETKIPVYDIRVKDNHNFYADGVLVHNCLEICLPTRPFEDIHDENGRIALCTLSAINWGNIRKPSDFEKPCDLAVRALDELLSYQDYPAIQAELATKEFRTLGVGIINLAYFLAKNDLKYDESALPMIDEYMEAMTYYLIKASNQLAIEKGACDLSHETKYGQGIVPFDTRKLAVDELVPMTERLDWDGLKASLKEHGIRNATLIAMMPSECQHWSTKFKDANNNDIDIHELCERGIVDWKSIEASRIPTKVLLTKPQQIRTENGVEDVYEVHYNGVKSTVALTFEDGSTYEFTENHRLKVNRNGAGVWVFVKDLQEGDDVVHVT